MLSQGWVLSGGWDGQGNSGDTFDPSALGSWFGWRWTGYVVLRGCWAVGVQRVGGTGRKSYRVEAWSRRWSRDQGGGCGMDQGGEAGQWGSFRARQRVLKQGFATGFGQYCFDSGVHRALALGTSTLRLAHTGCDRGLLMCGQGQQRGQQYDVVCRVGSESGTTLRVGR